MLKRNFNTLRHKRKDPMISHRNNQEERQRSPRQNSLQGLKKRIKNMTLERRKITQSSSIDDGINKERQSSELFPLSKSSQKSDNSKIQKDYLDGSYIPLVKPRTLAKKSLEGKLSRQSALIKSNLLRKKKNLSRSLGKINQKRIISNSHNIRIVPDTELFDLTNLQDYFNHLEVARPSEADIDDNAFIEQMETKNRNLFIKIQAMVKNIKAVCQKASDARNDRRDRHIHPDNEDNPDLHSRRERLQILYKSIMREEAEMFRIRRIYESKLNCNDQVLTDLQNQNVKTKEKLKNFSHLRRAEVSEMEEVKRGLLYQIDSQREATTTLRDTHEVDDKLSKMEKMVHDQKYRFRHLRDQEKAARKQAIQKQDE